MGKPIVWEMNGPMNRGGTESLIMEILRNKNENADIRLVVHSSTGNFSGSHDPEITALGIPVMHLPSYGSVGYKTYKKAFSNLIEQYGKPDVIHIHMNAVGGFISKIAAECGVPVRIVHCHADIKYKGSKLNILLNEAKLQIMRWYVNRYATDYWACSKEAAKRLFYSSKDAVIIPNMICVEKFLCSEEEKKTSRSKLTHSEDEMIIGAIGRIAPIKHYELAIEMVSALQERGVNAHFYCYGRAMDDAYFESLKKLSAENNATNYVHFMGETDCVPEILRGFDCFVMPSFTEGFGIAALEAQAAGLPTLVSSGVPKETDIGLGLFCRVDSSDPAAWADAALSCMHLAKAEAPAIIEAFNKKQLNSTAGCKQIEDNYNILWHKRSVRI